MRGLALVFAVSLGAVSLGSAIHAESTVPFQATIDTAPAPVGFCGQTCLELTIPGNGTASHMGSVAMVGLTQINVATLGQTGTSTLTAADGSSLDMSFTGSFTPGPAGPSDSSFGGTWTATGGTGRFDGVSGGGTYNGTASGPVGILFLNGSLSNPGKKR